MIRKLSNDGIPLYYQIKNDLRAQIEGGHLKPGDKLPSETELATLYNVSRMTVRQAITDLVEEGKLHRRRGVGTFVLHPRLVREHGSLVSFSEVLIAQGRSVRSVILTKEVIEAGEFASSIEVDPADEIVHIRRLRYVDGLPVALEDNYLPSDPGLGIMEDVLEHRSLYQLVEEHGHSLAKALQQIQARAATTEQARLLECEPGDPVLFGESVAFDNMGAVVLLTIACYRGDRYTMTMSLDDRPRTRRLSSEV